MGARDSPHRPLLLVLLGPLLEQYFDAGSVEFVLGGHRGSYWLLSDISGLVSCWLVFLLASSLFPVSESREFSRSRALASDL